MSDGSHWQQNTVALPSRSANLRLWFEKTGGQMNSRRQSTSPALVSSIVFAVTIFGALSAAAQTKPREDPSPQPVQNKELLIVQPPPTKPSTPDSKSPKSSS